MPRVSPEHMQARRDQIAHAAVEQFSKRGIHSTSMANIIEASGLSAGAIYRHFTGKDDIIAYVSRAAFEGVFSGVESMIDADPLPDPIAVIGQIAERMKSSNISTGFIVQVWGEAVANPVVRDVANEVYTHALAFLRECITVWLTTTQSLDLRTARERSSSQALVVLSLIYSHILQDALIETHDSQTLERALGHLIQLSDLASAADR
ncbi:MAG: TetR/AcrR family transcriptional regulator [Propionibacteriaceae bacterium]|nr:TetR/AcrR family transcriptional regulator [Propionibacteriaceae bacterium]